MTVTTLTPLTQKERALIEANVIRRNAKELRLQVAHGDPGALRDIYLDPPECLKNRYLYEPLMWAPGIREMKIMSLSRAAVADGVNLLMPFGRSSERARLWVLSNIRIHRNGQVSLGRTRFEPNGEGALGEPGSRITMNTKIDLTPLQRILQLKVSQGGITWGQAAYQCGFLQSKTGQGDGNELKRRLGLVRRDDRFQRAITIETALRICDGLDILYDDAGIPE